MTPAEAWRLLSMLPEETRNRNRCAVLRCGQGHVVIEAYDTTAGMLVRIPRNPVKMGPNAIEFHKRAGIKRPHDHEQNVYPMTEFLPAPGRPSLPIPCGCDCGAGHIDPWTVASIAHQQGRADVYLLGGEWMLTVSEAQR